MIDDEAEMSVNGLVFDIQRYSLHDGPGIRTVVFLKSCPLSCRWCANPESQNAFPELMLTSSRCLACEECIRVCPVRAISIEPSNNGTPSPTIDWNSCNHCMECTAVCVSGTLSRIGRVQSAREVLEIIRLDQPFFQRSGGGVTLSGGEPTSQFDFASRILDGCKQLGIHTALETSGYCAWEALAALLPYTDLLYFDLKHLDPVSHALHTGVTNELILQNLKRAIRERVDTIIRIPLVPGYNDDELHLRALATFISSLDQNPPVELIPFHQLGRSKYRRLGRTYDLTGIPPVEPASLAQRGEILHSLGLRVKEAI